MVRGEIVMPRILSGIPVVAGSPIGEHGLFALSNRAMYGLFALSNRTTYGLFALSNRARSCFTGKGKASCLSAGGGCHVRSGIGLRERSREPCRSKFVPTVRTRFRGTVNREMGKLQVACCRARSRPRDWTAFRRFGRLKTVEWWEIVHGGTK